jgi:hypothetical protein
MAGLFVVDPGARLSVRERALLRHLEREYTPALVRDVLRPLVTHTSPVSLRALDWAVVNWSKQHNVVCSSRAPGEMTNVHHAYRTTLAHWKRRLFDPFRRRARVGVRADGGEVLETTLGQANFALWTYRTGVLAYVLGHVEAIEADMNRVAQQQKRQRREAQRTGVRRRRTELTTSASAACVAYAAPTALELSGR